jgi:small GTP-binding protein
VEAIRVVATNAMNTAMVTEKSFIAKVLIAGASNVGKTSLVNSYVFGGFTEVTPTIGVNFAQKLCHGENGSINLSLWDLSGHPRFRCLMPRFCTGATGVVLIFDVTVRESLETARKWLQYISSWNVHNPNFSVVLVGNKTDLPQRIQPEAIQTVCKEENITAYVPCSAKTGKNIKVVFNMLCSAMQRAHLELIEQPRSLMYSST